MWLCYIASYDIISCHIMSCTNDKLTTPQPTPWNAPFWLRCTCTKSHYLKTPPPLRRRKFFDTVPKKTLSEQDFFFGLPKNPPFPLSLRRRKFFLVVKFTHLKPPPKKGSICDQGELFPYWWYIDYTYPFGSYLMGQSNMERNNEIIFLKLSASQRRKFLKSAVIRTKFLVVYWRD